MSLGEIIVRTNCFNLKLYFFFFYEDQRNLDEEISRLRKDLKPKVSKLHQLEGWYTVYTHQETLLIFNIDSVS